MSGSSSQPWEGKSATQLVSCGAVHTVMCVLRMMVADNPGEDQVQVFKEGVKSRRMRAALDQIVANVHTRVKTDIPDQRLLKYAKEA